MKEFSFRAARPVWASGRRGEMNLSLVLKAVVPKGEARLFVAGHSDYQVVINGRFFSQGPARAGHGFFRVDDMDVSEALTEERNVICIIVAGYNVNSYYLTHQEPFICAEIEAGGEIVAATGAGDGFAFSEYSERVQKVQRYSYQRPFVECYRYGAEYDRLFLDPDRFNEPVETDVSSEKRFILRETLQSDYERRDARTILKTGAAAPAKEKRSFEDWSYNGVNGTTIKGFRPEELEICSVNELYAFDFEVEKTPEKPFEPFTLGENGFALFDMGLNTTGFIRLRIKPEKDAVVWAIFNETLYAETAVVDHDACEVRWELEGGREYDLFSFEPYTYRYIQIFSQGSAAEVGLVSQYAEHYPGNGLKNLVEIKDKDLKKVYDAAIETFRQNAVDIFMDCPSRERAGWLCDSFFTSRTERALTGESRIEKAFLENFILPEKFPNIPEGMLPECYPSEEPGGGYIPNWAMWYLIELSEYFRRTGDRAFIDSAKERMKALAEFLSRYENEDGLLESLESWVFVEWSKANDFVQDVNYPSNMLYSLFLEKLGGLYGDRTFIEKAERLRETIRRASFDGKFFVDNAVRENGELVRTENRTETCQYYALFTKTATPGTFPELYEMMKTEFGPERDPETEHPDIFPSNAFIGNYLRLEILFENGEYDRVLKEIKEFFLPMAEKTGTLWENMTDFASCCHGFASHVAYWINEMSRLGIEL